MLLAQKGVGTRSHSKKRCGNAVPTRSHLTTPLLTRPPGYPNRGYSPDVTKLLIEHRVTRPPYSIGTCRALACEFY